MVDPGSADRSHRLNLETSFLAFLYAKHPGGVLISGTWPPEGFVDLLKSSYPDPGTAETDIRAHFGGILLSFTESGWIRLEALSSGDRRVTLRPNGIREIGRRQPSFTWDEQDRARQHALDLVASMQEMSEATEAEQQALNQRIAGFDDKVAQHERNFYAQIFPLFAVFVAAFALILTGAQATMKISATDPAQIFYQSAAIMGPIIVGVLVLLVVSWGISRIT